jgi:hypothetical protein
MLTSLSTLASASFVISSGLNKSNNKIDISYGFSDSSFFYSKSDTKRERSFCYVGKAKDVCGMIDMASFNSSDGRHDNLKVKSCEVVEVGDGFEVYEQATKVVAKYNLSDDYGSDFDVTRIIERCSKAN